MHSIKTASDFCLNQEFKNVKHISDHLGVNVIACATVGSRALGVSKEDSDYDHCFVFEHIKQTFIPAKPNIHFNMVVDNVKIDVNAYTKESFAWEIFRLRHHAICGLFGKSNLESSFFHDLRKVVLQYRNVELIRSLLFQAKSYLGDKRIVKTSAVCKSTFRAVSLVLMAMNFLSISKNKDYLQNVMHIPHFTIKMGLDKFIVDSHPQHLVSDIHRYVEQWMNGNRVSLPLDTHAALNTAIDDWIAATPDTQKGTRRPTGDNMLFEAHETDFVKAINAIIYT